MDSDLSSDPCSEKSFSQSVVFSFFLTLSLDEQQSLILTKSNLLLFFFMVHAFDLSEKGFLYLSRGQKVSVIYFILEVLYLGLQFISSFACPEGIMVTVLFCLVFLHMGVQLFQRHILKVCPFSSELPQCFCKKYFEYVCEALILASVPL